MHSEAKSEHFGEWPVVLIAEDDDFQRRTLARIVRSHGAGEVIEAADGSEALAAIEARPQGIGLILCDLSMPNMDGMELVRHLGQSGQKAALAITSAQDPQTLHSVETMCRAYGIEPLGVLQKPVLPEQIGDLLRKSVARNSGRPRRPHAAQHCYDLEAITQALEEKQFVAHFQPKVRMRDNCVVGAEALARWQHPEDGIVGPGAFIGLLEEAGRIDDLTIDMLRQAAAARRRCQAQGLALNVSVNLSQTSLVNIGFADLVTGIVEAEGCNPCDMTLEITETAAMTEVAPALENLVRLRMRGFGLSIDDFGTGYASMQQLGRIAFSELKIDRGFIADLARKREARAIVDASIDIARRLKMTSVAEGIETKDDWYALHESGCDIVQGFFIARPMAEDRLVEFCRGYGQ